MVQSKWYFTTVRLRVGEDSYYQLDGVVMSSLLVPTLADLCIGTVEDKAKLLEGGLCYYGRYVDGILVMLENERYMDKI